jgi:hypothetical protein
MVVQTIAVDVMDNFSRFQIATNNLLHHKSMLSNIVLTVSERMIVYFDIVVGRVLSFSNDSTPMPMSSI